MVSDRAFQGPVSSIERMVGIQVIPAGVIHPTQESILDSVRFFYDGIMQGRGSFDRDRVLETIERSLTHYNENHEDIAELWAACGEHYNPTINVGLDGFYPFLDNIRLNIQFHNGGYTAGINCYDKDENKFVIETSRLIARAMNLPIAVDNIKALVQISTMGNAYAIDLAETLSVLSDDAEHIACNSVAGKMTYVELHSGQSDFTLGAQVREPGFSRGKMFQSGSIVYGVKGADSDPVFQLDLSMSRRNNVTPLYSQQASEEIEKTMTSLIGSLHVSSRPQGPQQRSISYNNSISTISF